MMPFLRSIVVIAGKSLVRACTYFLIGHVFLSSVVLAQPNQAVELFSEDITTEMERRAGLKKKYLRSYVRRSADEMKVRGDSVEFSDDGQTIRLKDKVVASAGEFAIQSDEGEVNIEKQEGVFNGDVFLSHPQFSIGCQKAYFNVPYEVGVFNDARLRLDEVEFNADASSLVKYSEFGYLLHESAVTTCDTDVLPAPWKISSDKVDITEDGYAHMYWSSLAFYGVPVFYTPYMGFPVGQEKSSGLLIPSVGFGSQNGLQVWLPVHIVLDDATDLTVTPFIETRTRQGVEFEFRKAFSTLHELNSRWLFSDESLRDGDLRGLLPRSDGVLPYKESRAGGYYYHRLTSDPETPVPYSLLADIHYVNDDLMLRELEDNQIGFRNAPFLTSRLLGTTSFGSLGSMEIFGEWNQAIDANLEQTDDAILQRLPEVNLRVGERWRPFGFNPYGLQLTTLANVSYTDFYREEGLSGQRVNFNPSIAVPFHYESYFRGNAQLSYFDTRYALDDIEGVIAANGQPIDDSESRRTYVASTSISTVLERIYELSEDNWLSTLTGLGFDNYELQLQKVKHELEPFLRYSFAPDEDQDGLPLFDSLDRIRNRSIVTYGFTNRWIGRLESIKSYRSEIEEVTPTVEDLPELGLIDSVANLEFPREALGGNQISILRSGELRNIAYVTLLQSYDIIEARDDIDPLRDEFSDVYIDFGLTPNSLFAFNTTANYDMNNGEISSWTSGLSLRDDRGDAVGLRYSLVSPKILVDNIVTDGVDISNIDGQVELVLTDRVKFGYYARYDQTAAKFIDQIFGIRMANGCKCWSVDLGFSDRTNPDRQQLLMRFNLNGLGRLQQSVLYNSIRESLRSFSG
jgi:LPS-assembly protein